MILKIKINKSFTMNEIMKKKLGKKVLKNIKKKH